MLPIFRRPWARADAPTALRIGALLLSTCAIQPAFADDVPSPAATADIAAVSATATPVAPATADAASTDCGCAPAGTPIVIEVLNRIVSDECKTGDAFAFRLAQAISVDGKDVIPAGTRGVGEVVHAKPAHGSGQAGELILAARYLDLGGRHIALRGMKLAGAGDDRSGMTAGVGIAIGVFAMFIHGGEMEVPVGALAHAKLAEAYIAPDDTNPVAVPSSTSSIQE